MEDSKENMMNKQHKEKLIKHMNDNPPEGWDNPFSLMAENPQDVSDSLDSSGDLNTGYQMEGGADGSTNGSESVTVPLPKRIYDENKFCSCPNEEECEINSTTKICRIPPKD